MKKIILYFLFVAMATMSVDAKTIYVKLEASGDGSSWSNALGSLNDAVTVAVAGDEIWIGPGLFTIKRVWGVDKDGNAVLTTNGLVLEPTVSIYGGFAGTETDISQRAKVADGKPWQYVNVTEIKGEVDAMRLIQMANKNADASTPYAERPRFEPGIFDGLKVTHVNNSGNRIMWSREASAIWRNCQFIGAKDNTSCLYFEDAKGGVENCYFEGCKRAILIQTAAVTRGYGETTFVRNCEFTQSVEHAINIFNLAGDAGLTTTSAEITNCKFNNNTTTGVFLTNPSSACIMMNQGDDVRPVVIKNCTFKNNTFTGYGATALAKWGGGNLIVYNNVFEGNTNGYLPGEGENGYGAIVASHTASGQNAKIGNAIFNNVFSGNSAQRLIYSVGGYIFNNTVANNTGLNYFQGAPFAWNNIFSNNLDAGVDAPVRLDIDATYLANANTVDVTIVNDNVLDNVLITNPGFVNTSIGDYRLTASSPCVGIGSNLLFVDEFVSAGLAAFMNGIVDMGGTAYDITASTLNAGAYQGTFATGLKPTEKYAANFEVYAVEGGVIVKVQEAAKVNLYSFNGQLIATRQVNSGETLIPLAKGLYLVEIASATVKVAVK